MHLAYACLVAWIGWNVYEKTQIFYQDKIAYEQKSFDTIEGEVKQAQPIDDTLPKGVVADASLVNLTPPVYQFSIGDWTVSDPSLNLQPDEMNGKLFRVYYLPNSNLVYRIEPVSKK